MRTKKMKKVFSIIILGIVMVTIGIIQVAAMNTTRVNNRGVNDIVTFEGLRYKITSINPAKVTVTGVTDTSLTEITIPNEVTDAGDKYSVTSIGNRAFVFHAQKLTSIVIPNSVTTIEMQAFDQCQLLTSVTIQNKAGAESQLTTIGVNAFYSTGLTSIVIPNSVTTIDNNAFNACKALTSVKIENEPDAKSLLTSIGDNAFYASGLISIAIPNGVTSIGRGAFQDCKALASVEIENTDIAKSQLTTIVSDAFRNSGITSIVLPQSVETLGSSAFNACKALTSVTIQNEAGAESQLKNIFGNAFYASGITSIVIPQSVVSIKGQAFYECKALASVTIENTADKPSKLETIDGYAFYNTKLTTMFIPESVITIGTFAFGGCPDLSVLVFRTTNVATFGKYLFSGSAKDIKAYVPWAPKADYKTSFETGTVLSGYAHTLTVLGYGELVMPATVLVEAPIWESGYSQSIVATDGIEGETVTYEITDGALPDGLIMDTNGNITGTPTKVETFPFTVTAKVSNTLVELSYIAKKEYTIEVTDKIAPVITIENTEVTIEINGNTSEEDFIKSAVKSTTDNSKGIVKITTNFGDVVQNALGEKVVTITATDESNNVSTKEVTVKVTDTIAPELTIENNEVTIKINGGIDETKFLELVKITTTDNSKGVVNITTNFGTVEQNAIGEKVVTITATDESGNVSTTTVTVKVVDTTPEPTTEEPTTIHEETTTTNGTDVETGDTFTTPLFFTVVLFSTVGILVSRKRKEELQG